MQTFFYQELNAKLETTSEEGTQHNKEYEETKKQIEEDADREILDIKNKYERRWASSGLLHCVLW